VDGHALPDNLLERHGNETQLALRNPKIEFIVAQHPWFENDCIYSDIILPINTYMEVDDIITNIRQGTQQPNIMIADKAIEPIGESKSDFEAVVEVSKSFEDLEEKLTEGLTTFSKCRKRSGGTWAVKSLWTGRPERKEYWIYNTAEDWKNDPPGFREFYEDPVKLSPAHTFGQTGILLGSTGQSHFPDDKERPPIPKWIEKSHNHDERLSSHRAQMFSMLHDVQPWPLACTFPM
jgi:anaerobic selenocysteine-containing dehydrogenase